MGNDQSNKVAGDVANALVNVNPVAYLAAGGGLHQWPQAVNDSLEALFYPSRAEAKAKARAAGPPSVGHVHVGHPSGHLSVGHTGHTGHTGHAAGRAEAREDLVNYMERVVGKIFS